MRYQAQVRTILHSGEWSHWTNVGDPMNDEERQEFLALQAKVPQAPAEFRFIQVSVTFPSVLKTH